MDEDEGVESLTLDTPDDGVTDLPDGGAIVRLDDGDGDTDTPGFADNLAETMADSDLSLLATALLDLIDKDKDARSKRDEQYAEGIKRTGLGDEAPGGADFAGASRAVHPVLTEACVDFAARAMKELFPVGGPVKDSIEGTITQKRLEKANRKTSLMNWQLTKQCLGFRAEMEQMMTQVPLGGSQYMKMSWDVRRNRPLPLFVAIDDIYLPFAATNFYTAQRKTHVQYLTQLDFEERVASGMYRDVDLGPAGMDIEQSASGKASDRIEGRTQTSYNEDGLRTVYEVFVTMEIEGTGEEGPKPWIVSVDQSTRRVLALYRNWSDDDDTAEELQWFAEFPFIPWRGAYAIGLPQMIGNLAGAATGALRALLDSAHIANAPAGLKLKGAKIGGQSRSPRPGETLEIEGGLNVDDVRKVFMPVPTTGPSPVLFQLLGFLADSAKEVVRTSVEDLADGGANTPVGTTLARIEQGMVVYSSIHGRMNDGMARLLSILHRLNGLYLDDEKLEAAVGTELATRADFNGPMDVAPVSDPNIYSDAQRYAQAQAIAQRAITVPQLYDLRKVEARVLQTLKIPNPDDLLAPALTPTEQNAVNENVTASLGKPVTAFPEQDHLAHLQTHLPFMQSPMFGMSQLIAPAFLPVMINHIKEHLVWWYASRVFDIGTQEVGRDIGTMMREMVDDNDTEGRKALDKMLAEAANIALQQAQQELASVPAVVQQAQDLLHKLMQPPAPPLDPKLALEQQRLAMDDRHAQAQQTIDAQRLQLDASSAQTDAQKAAAADAAAKAKLQQAQAVTAMHEQAESERAAMAARAKLTANMQDNETAMAISSAQIAEGRHSRLSDGHGLGEGR